MLPFFIMHECVDACVCVFISTNFNSFHETQYEFHI